jgi:hypothetical protein
VQCSYRTVICIGLTPSQKPLFFTTTPLPVSLFPTHHHEMTPTLKDASHRLKTLFTTFLSRSRSRFNLRRRKHVKANAHIQGLKSTPVMNPDVILSPSGTLSPQPQSQFVPNNLITVVQPPSPPTAVESSRPTPTPTPNPGGAPMTDGLSPPGRSNLPSRLAVHTQVPKGVQGTRNIAPDTPLNPTSDVPGDSAVDSEYPTPRPPRSRALLVRK